ncbi:MAG: L-aspartate oxidase [Flavobacteriales bacterium]|nr:L-aspartate oxidase [Flavobacteriales bacterium]MBP9079268.1 L-aspartate oxidase [Flavobacteriales bacterium]
MDAMEKDVIVVGGGIAGMAFAERLADLAGPEVRILLFTKAPVEASNSYLAQGGVAAVVLPEDSVEEHVQDTLAVGAGRCDPHVVRLIVEEGPASIARLVGAGARFDADAQGRLQLAREGGHSQARVVHHRDTTGAEIVRVLHQRVACDPRIRVLEHQCALDLLMHGEGDLRRCTGLKALDIRTGEVSLYSAAAVVLATGGLGQVYRHTTNPAAATGDGIAMAIRAGVPLRDMAFVQFHPTALYDPANGPTFLISEAVRGAGARLLHPDGAPLMQGQHPKGDLAPRNVVARAIHRAIQGTGHPHVWLDTAPIGVEAFGRHFPNIANTCGQRGIVAGRDPIPVMPAAHYACGGIRTDDHGETALHGLFALGECASSGLHGADRLASNSLLEALVMPRRAAEAMAARKLHQPVGERGPGSGRHFTMQGIAPLADQLIQEIKDLMTAQVGILRTTAGLQLAQQRLAAMEAACHRALAAHRPAWAWAQVRDMAQVSGAIAASALEQRQNVGAHWCQDLADAAGAGATGHATGPGAPVTRH